MGRPVEHDEEREQIRPWVSARVADELRRRKKDTGASLSFLVNQALERAYLPAVADEQVWDLGGDGGGSDLRR